MKRRKAQVRSHPRPQKRTGNDRRAQLTARPGESTGTSRARRRVNRGGTPRRARVPPVDYRDGLPPCLNNQRSADFSAKALICLEPMARFCACWARRKGSSSTSSRTSVRTSIIGGIGLATSWASWRSGAWRVCGGPSVLLGRWHKPKAIAGEHGPNFFMLRSRASKKGHRQRARSATLHQFRFMWPVVTGGVNPHKDSAGCCLAVGSHRPRWPSMAGWHAL
jgi:hypothetical protein